MMDSPAEMRKADDINFTLIFQSRETWVDLLSNSSVGNAENGVVTEDDVVDGLSIPVDNGFGEVHFVEEKLSRIDSFHLAILHKWSSMLTPLVKS